MACSCSYSRSNSSSIAFQYQEFEEYPSPNETQADYVRPKVERKEADMTYMDGEGNHSCKERKSS
jgi:hypothetical protein